METRKKKVFVKVTSEVADIRNRFLPPVWSDTA
jgi:hypothetical protein